MLEAVGQGVTSVIGWIGSVVTALTGETGELKELLGLFAVGVSVSAVMLGIKAIRSITWGA